MAHRHGQSGARGEHAESGQGSVRLRNSLRNAHFPLRRPRSWARAGQSHSGAMDAAIAEMVDNQMIVLKSGSHVMTNYYLSNCTSTGQGFERYETLFNHWQNWNEKKECKLDDMKKGHSKIIEDDVACFTSY